MTRAQRIALAMRGYRADFNVAVIRDDSGHPVLLSVTSKRLIVNDISTRPTVTVPPPHTFVLLAREKGLPCS